MPFPDPHHRPFSIGERLLFWGVIILIAAGIVASIVKSALWIIG